MSQLCLDYFDNNHPLYKKIKDFGIPNSKTEQYKNFPIKSILEREYTFKKLEYSQMHEGTKLIINNGVITEYPKGAKIFFDKNFEADEEHFDVLYFCSHTLSGLTATIEILEDIEFEIQHIFTQSETLLAYRIAIKIIQNIKVKVYETFNMLKSRESLFLYGVDVEIKNDSTMLWIRDENRQENETSVVGTHKFTVAKQGALELKTFDYGAANSLHLYKIDLGSYAWVNAAHLLLASNKARRGNVVQINHHEAYAKSVQEARSILKDTATGIFDAKIYVGPNAPYSNASQNAKAILLDEHARMYAKPQLEIYIDELEASHGSSIGTLDEEALFYLCSRGIRLEDARKILVLSFANRLIDTVEDEKYRQKIRKDFELLM
ncbi:MAG: Fe-S cluster assembly protein SufD [Sulfurimonas sp.]|jgi:Fe-S cluster assembly protein SufD|uniref:SufD family Fe-S cluster assembly protein n=1 Tax=Sulfurimonas sp. TaxID=2022749 RepID=UPI0039E338D0